VSAVGGWDLGIVTTRRAGWRAHRGDRSPVRENDLRERDLWGGGQGRLRFGTFLTGNSAGEPQGQSRCGEGGTDKGHVHYQVEVWVALNARRRGANKNVGEIQACLQALISRVLTRSVQRTLITMLARLRASSQIQGSEGGSAEGREAPRALDQR